eukprot:jgi/Chrpa1/1233/Chrysochromulina_OHIO_Genome00002577-RA
MGGRLGGPFLLVAAALGARAKSAISLGEHIAPSGETNRRALQATLCTNTCIGNPSYASDGDCDDGGPGSEYGAWCVYGTDCIDCGPRQPGLCTNACYWSSDAECDDGGPGSEFPVCLYGTDCIDCGLRQPRPPSPPALCTNTCNWAADAECDDGGPGSEFYSASGCPYGTDCFDCGTRQPDPCTNTCDWSSDGSCDDGGPGSEYGACLGAASCSWCPYGTDCADCGTTRQLPPPQPPPPPPPPRPPRAPQCNHGLPLDLVLVFDHSGSMAPFQAQVLEFARELVLQLDFGPSASRVGLVEFDDTAHVLSYLSSDPNAVLAAMATAQQANGWTNISSGLASGLAVLQAKGGWTTRSKVLLLLTDGEQNPQYGGAAAAIAQAATVRAAGVQIFGVGFGSANPATIADISSSPASLYAFTAANIGAVREHFRSQFCTLLLSPRAPPPPP